MGRWLTREPNPGRDLGMHAIPSGTVYYNLGVYGVRLSV